MADLEYEITFLSEWHCGSGLSGGADTDALVIKDSDGLPYIPGKTIKGLFREAAEDLIDLKYKDVETSFKANFGFFDDKDNAMKGDVFFTNAELKETDREQILENSLSKYLYRRVSSTKINADGVAEDGSLRSIETVVPCTLSGKILHVAPDLEALLKDAAKYIKHIGVNRNRGLGRVKIEFN